MTPTDQLTAILWFLGVVFSVFSALIGAIWWLFWKQNGDSMKELRARLAKLEEENAALHKEMIDRRDDLARSLFSKVAEQDKTIGDVRETVGSFGGTYLPRREWEVERDRLERHRRNE